jgi:hypothetical protein
VPGNVDDAEEDGNVQFDSDGLEEAVGGLYEGAKSSTLTATILLLNLCTVHGVSNCFMNELFCILHGRYCWMVIRFQKKIMQRGH